METKLVETVPTFNVIGSIPGFLLGTDCLNGTLYAPGLPFTYTQDANVRLHLRKS